MIRSPRSSRPCRLPDAGHVVVLAAAAALLPACQPVRPAPADAPTREVNVGYGHQSEREVTGAIASSTAQELATHRASRVEEMLEGRFAGLDVIRVPGGGFSLRIRGSRTFSGSNEPLIVVDGIPLSTPSPLDFINPSTIARIDVLKDGTAAAYGSRGANGVILITTKRGF